MGHSFLMTIPISLHRLRSMKKIELFVFIATFFLLHRSALGLEALHIIPENDISIPSTPVRTKISPLDVTEAEYINVTKTLHRIYAPAIKERGGVELVMKTDWEDGTVNAYATREVTTWTVHVPGGIARASGMTKDSLALIVCHELGHHLGGAPRTFLYNGWPSSEGQSDYWATSKCLKKYYEELVQEEIAIDRNIPQKILEDCSGVFTHYTEFKICIRTLLASIDFAHFLNELPGTKVKISIETPDTRVVKGTNTNDYPRPQCRLDTLYQGALCTVGSSAVTSETDPKVASCTDETKPGARPRCWFKP